MEKMVKIKMTRTNIGSPNGYDVNSYQEGEIYEVPQSLADNFIDQGCAKLHRGKVPKPEPEVVEAPETKVVEPPETKEDETKEMVTVEAPETAPVEKAPTKNKGKTKK